jgi:hypothetical protein
MESKMSNSSEDFSKTFYPFLHEDETPGEDRDGLTDDLRLDLVAKARESAEVKIRFFDENKETILQASLAMARAFHRRRKLLVCGNGGSASGAVDYRLTIPTASVHRAQEMQVTLYHLMWDMVHQFLEHRSPLAERNV